MLQLRSGVLSEGIRTVVASRMISQIPGAVSVECRKSQHSTFHLNGGARAFAVFGRRMSSGTKPVFGSSNTAQMEMDDGEDVHLGMKGEIPSKKRERQESLSPEERLGEFSQPDSFLESP